MKMVSSGTYYTYVINTNKLDVTGYMDKQLTYEDNINPDITSWSTYNNTNGYQHNIGFIVKTVLWGHSMD